MSNMENPRGKLALITGASSGIGLELARFHAEQGGDLVVVARRTEKLEALKHELEEKHKVQVHIISKDLGQPQSAEQLYNEVKAAQLQVDYLINNAGFGGIGQFHERPWADDLNMMQVNMVALTALTQLFLTDFLARGSGKVLNVSSTASLVPGPLQAVYYATKAYVTSLSNAIAAELVGTNVTVTTLLPGATTSEFGAISGMDKTQLFQGKLASARSVAVTGYNAMLCGRLEVIAGVAWPQKFMLLLAKFLPKQLVMSQVRQMQQTRER